MVSAEKPRGTAESIPRHLQGGRVAVNPKKASRFSSKMTRAILVTKAVRTMRSISEGVPQLKIKTAGCGSTSL